MSRRPQPFTSRSIIAVIRELTAAGLSPRAVRIEFEDDSAIVIEVADSGGAGPANDIDARLTQRIAEYENSRFRGGNRGLP